MAISLLLRQFFSTKMIFAKPKAKAEAEAKATGKPRSKIPRIAKWIAGIVCGVAVVAALGLGGLIVFGTATPPAELTSVSDPMRHIDFSDLPPLQHFKAHDGQALSYRHPLRISRDT